MNISAICEKLWVRRLAIVLIFSVILLELYQLTYWRDKPTIMIGPIIWFVSGIVTALLGWFLAVYAARHFDENSNPGSSNWTTILRWIIYIIGLVIGIVILSAVYKEVPEINNMSDILPAKREYVRRLLSGEIVYRPIPFGSYDLQPTFLPMRWLPFVAAELGNIDYRWISFAGLVIGLAVWNIRMSQNGNVSIVEILIKCLLPFFCLKAFADTDAISLGVAVELLIVGYYLLFARYFFSLNSSVAALVIVFCLLSRYSFLLWLPLLFLVYWKEYNSKYVFKILGYLLLGVLFIYFIPFCLHDNGKHVFEASQHYLNACFATWHTESWLPEGSLPSLHSKGIGFSIWFLLKAPGDLKQRFDLMLQVSLLLQVAVTLLFSLFYWYRVRGRSRYEVYAFLLMSLKIFMMVFNGFLIAPFSYLFEVSFYLSFPLLFILPLKSLWSEEHPVE